MGLWKIARYPDKVSGAKLETEGPCISVLAFIWQGMQKKL